MKVIHPSRYLGQPITWEKFKAAVRSVDRDSLLKEAGSVTAAFARGEDPEEWKRFGITPWTVADVARTALAWGGPASLRADRDTLFRLCNKNSLLIDEESTSETTDSTTKIPDSESVEAIAAARERLARMLFRIYFEQFPGQRSIANEVARSVLLFGSAVEFPENFVPQMMTPDWFENLTGGLTFDEYVESIFLFSVIAQQQNGAVSIEDLDAPALQELSDVFSLDAARLVFTEHLVTTIDEFKNTNREWQDPLPSAQKKFAYNPLTNRPFVEGLAATPIAPWVQAIITKALPPSIYFLPPTELRKPFADDLGPVFQHYTGRQLALINGPSQVLPEVPYREGKQQIDSCDWFLDLPDVVVLVECKARQPIESLRIAGTDWMRSIEDSIGKGIRQLNRSNAHIDQISAQRTELDLSKPRVGLVITLEPFYLNQNWLIRERLDKAKIPTGVLSIGELEYLVLLSATELSQALLDAAAAAEGNVMLLNDAIKQVGGRENSLLAHTWDSIGLFRRVDAAADRLGMEPEIARDET